MESTIYSFAVLLTLCAVLIPAQGTQTRWACDQASGPSVLNRICQQQAGEDSGPGEKKDGAEAPEPDCD